MKQHEADNTDNEAGENKRWKGGGEEIKRGKVGRGEREREGSSEE